MSYSAKQSRSKQIGLRLLIQVTAALILILLLSGQTLAAPETMLTIVDDGDGDSVGGHTSLALNSNGHPVISYHDETNGFLKLAVCNDAACTNPTLTTVDDGDGDSVGAHTSLALNSNGHAVISYYDETNGDLKLAVCNNAACNNPTLTIVDDGSGDDVGSHTSLALNSNGHPVISYYDFTNNALKLAVCNNATCTPFLSTITTIDASDVGIYTSLALNSSGHPVISYLGTTNDDLKLAVCNNAACTNPTLTTVDDGGGDNVGRYTSLALNSSDHPVISYFDLINRDLKLAICNNAACTNPTLTTVDDGDGDNVGSYTSLALNSSGNAVISYRDITNGALKLAVCNNAACTNPTLTTVDDGDGDNVGFYTSLALNSSDHPVISYSDFTNDDLKLSICPICTAPARTTVDSSGNVGLHTALALNSSGHPVISYRDGTNQALKLALCSNPDCSNLTLTTVDNVDNVGSWTSVALNSSGHAVISYRDIAHGDLKLAVCNDETCSSPAVITIDSGPDNVGAYTSLALNSSDHAVISYRDGTNGTLKLAVCNNVACTNPTLTVIDSTADVGRHTALTLNSNGRPIISYRDDSNQALKLAVCDDATCTTPTLRTIDSNGDVGTHTALALNSSGHPVISYFDNTNEDLKLALCNIETCTAPTITTVDSDGNVGQYTSLALSSSNLALISYRDGTSGALKLAVCRDLACTEATFTIVDSAGDAGQYTALVLDSNSFPVISYRDINNEDLRLASYSTLIVESPSDRAIYLPLIFK